MTIQQPPNPLEYYRLVWAIVGLVPKGMVTTYGQIASMIPPPGRLDPEVYRRIAPRWVGDAMTRAFSEDVIEGTHEAAVPWQRVINSQGMIAMRSGGTGYQEQYNRLVAEGVEFDSRDRVDFTTYGWAGPDPTLIEEQGLLPPKPLVKKKTDDDGPTQLSLF